MVDLDALEAAGIADAHGRAGLIAYLDSLGFTAEDMVDAERRGRLFGLAGDVLQWSGRPTHSLRAVAERLGVPLADLARAWQALGLTVSDLDLPALSQADVDALASWRTISAMIGADAALNFLRIIGATMARLAEASGTMIRQAQPDLLLGHSRDELTTARAHRAVAELVPGISALMDSVWRHHIASARAYFEAVVHDASAMVTCGVGFADLSGFTVLTQRLSPTELSDLLVEFSGAVSDVVHADGGRVVKFIGDEVMWVAPAPAQLVDVATDLVEYPRAREAGLGIRAGLGYGSVLAIGGDYFGTPVNLAARLVSAATPGQILAAADVRDALPDRPATPLDPLTLKGFEGPVTAYDLHVGG
ncbi:adenylate/guanylate cyclase domain-containing protein [Mycolicibacterium sp. ND9-15]|uniref:adenylate/guanylate cyclase domain-containing protein n=1 Tax=Mycolicibacterium sp. ND9-15 TaxID=3042320 RepID=UPI002DDB70E4|nr:adenylate/guanylate cyclase domain-containing protein [Mycolicibacterium sp. ND9-15]WSE55995.1 adenylate/guanylate cyclase domain-containing protein [Mycolicibacterium sp. ND9-15]